MKKTFFETFIENQNKFTRSLKKTYNKNKFKKCSRKCNRVLQRKTFKSKPQDIKQVLYNTCVKNYCNPKCKGFYAFQNKCEKRDFYKNIHNGFSKNVSKKRRTSLIKKGVLSNCIGNHLI
jgi:hypothetical protein